MSEAEPTSAAPNSVDTAILLRRAIELDQLGQNLDLDQPLDRDTLSEIAADVGISPGALATAIAEAKAGALVSRSILDRVVGPRLISGHRTVSIEDSEATERLVKWLAVTHGLKPRVRSDGVIVAVKRHDLAGKISTGIRRAQGLGGLSTANSVTATAVGPETPAKAGKSANARNSADSGGAVCLVADVGAKRNEAIIGGSAVAVGASAAVVVITVVTGPVALVGIPVAAGIGTIVARLSHRSTVVRVSESVDHAVDGVAQGEKPPQLPSWGPAWAPRIRRPGR